MHRATRVYCSVILVLSLTPVLHVRAQDPQVTAADIDVLLASIRQVHPNPHRLFSPSAFDSVAGRIKEQLASLSPHGAALETQRLLAMVGDGHTE